MSIDSPERAKALRSSPELAALRHLGRAYGVGVRRIRRRGPAVYGLGVRGATTVADQGAYGSIEFTDDGRLRAARFAGQGVHEPSLPAIGLILQTGSYLTEIVTDAPGPALIAEEAAVTGPIILPVLEDVLEDALELSTTDLTTSTDVLAFEPATTTVSIPIILSVPQAIEEEPVEEPVPAWKPWTRFIGGSLLFLLFATVLLSFGAGLAVNGWMIAMSWVAGTVGSVVMLLAIRENDARLAALQPVGQ